MTSDKLIFNLGDSSWGFIPDDVWMSILQRFITETCDGVAFDTITTPEDISRLEIFYDHSPLYLRQDRYKPYSCPPSVKNGNEYQHEVAVFQFDTWIASLMFACHFNSWSVDQEGSAVDEMTFWTGSQIRIQAVPYEGQVFFHDLTDSERRLLFDCDKRIKPNLYPA